MTSAQDTPSDQGPVLGIDLGTTNSLVAWYRPGAGPEVIPDREGRRTLPSVVRFLADGRVEAIGHAARAGAIEHATRTVSSVKRLMGRALADADADAAYLAYEVVEGEHATARVRLEGGKTVTPQEVSAHVLRALRERAEAALGRACARAVITVPAYFDDAQRQATRDAARLAGLDAMRVVNEPTAAALAYGLGQRGDAPETIVVYDLGGGTFDVTVLRVTPKREGDELGTDFFEVLATAGDTRLGGDDFDRALIDHVRRAIEEEIGRAIDLPPTTRQAFATLAERTKIALSEEPAATFAIELGDGARFERTITRVDLEGLIAPLVERSLEACARALRDAKVPREAIDRVVLVGGSTRVPLVRERVGAFFDSEPYTALDPDLVVALGAAVQASIMEGGDARDMLLLDVLPLSLGIETVGGAVAKLILRNSTVPARATEMFSTSVDGQTSIAINVLQGEREMASDCRSLGSFVLRGVPPMPAGIPQIEVEFLVDANGVLGVRAYEKRSGKRAGVQIVPNHGLTRDEVERIEAESFEHARDDMTRHRVVDLVSNASMDLRWIEEGLASVEGVLDDERVRTLRALIGELRSMVERGRADWRSVDANAFAQLKQRLDEASVPVHEARIARTLREEA